MQNNKKVERELLQISEIEKGDWIATAYASTCDVDEKGDQMTLLALDKAKEHFLKYKTVLFNHDQNRPIGTLASCEVDDKGMKVSFKVSKSEKDVWTKMVDGTICKMSIMFKINDATYVQYRNGQFIRQIKDCTPYEVSVVSVPMNGDAEIESCVVNNADMPLSMDHGIYAPIYDNLNMIKEVAGYSKPEYAEMLYLAVSNIEDVLMRMDSESVDEMADLGEVRPHTTPMMSEDAAWKSSEAVKRLREWATNANGELDVKKMAKGFAWYDDSQDTPVFKLPHHDIIDGVLKVNWRGVAAAMAALAGARGGVDIPESDRAGVFKHLAKHYEQFHKEIPEVNLSDDDDSELTLSDHNGNIEKAKGKHTYKKQILRYGRWFHPTAPNGVLNIDEKTIANIVENFNNKTIEHVFVPLNHDGSLLDNAGEVVKLEKTANGLDAVINVKRQDVVDSIDADIIKSVSASIDFNYKDKQTGHKIGPTLKHVALVDEPYIKHMSAFVPLS